MTKTRGTFQKLASDTTRMPGPTAIIVSGYAEEERRHLATLLDADNELRDIPTIHVCTDDGETTVTALVEQAKERMPPPPEPLPRAIIMSGLTGEQMHRLMHACREANFSYQLWASVTEHTATWPLKQLLSELVRERAALKDAMAKRRGTPKGGERD